MAYFIGICFTVLLVGPAVWQMCNALSWTRPPNIILLLTDDQDTSGIVPMVNIQKLIGMKGATFKNAFVNTPLCCPSRSSLLTGLYQHNTRVFNNSVSGDCCSREWQRQYEPITFASSLKGRGYRTFYAGKYLNQYGSAAAGGLKHIPNGWDWWIGLKGNSRYYNYTLSINGTAHYFNETYLTDHIREFAMDFLRSQTISKRPFFMVLAPPAPHAPYLPAVRHQNCYPNASVPRTPNFNPPEQDDKHWIIRQPPWPLPQSVLNEADESWRRRWCTLLSVDEMAASLVDEVSRLDQLNNTFFIVTSDNGYHLGHYGLPWDKRQPYDTDLRVPLLIRGPGVFRGTRLSPVLTVDIAPTLLDMAGLPVPDYMDGKSFLPLLHSSSELLQPRMFMVEYFGESNRKTVAPQCSSPSKSGDLLSNCNLESACKCQDSANNTYSCVRDIGLKRDFILCRFHDDEQFLEAYNVHADPYQMKNQAPFMSKKKISLYLKALRTLQRCSGRECRQLPFASV